MLTVAGLTCNNDTQMIDCTMSLEYDTWIDEYDCSLTIAGKPLTLPACPEVRFSASPAPSSNP